MDTFPQNTRPEINPEAVKLLSQGTFGCAYFPYVQCDGTVDTEYDYLSKIQGESTYLREKEIGDKIKEIPNFSYYFAPVVDGCPLHLRRFKELVDTAPCTLLSKPKYATGAGSRATGEEKDDVAGEEKDEGAGEDDDSVAGEDDDSVAEEEENVYDAYPDTSKIYTSKLKFVPGESLHSYFKRMQSMFSAKETDISYHFQQLYRIFHMCKYAIGLLRQNNIVHYDIKLENIMYNLVQRTPIVIDFGLSIYTPLLTDLPDSEMKRYLYTPKFYQFWPIESFIASNHLWQPGNETLDQATCVHGFMKNVQNTVLPATQSHPDRKQIKSYIDSFYQFHLDTPSTVEDCIQTMPTWDLYGLAISFVRILPYLYTHPPAAKWAKQLFLYIFSDRSDESLLVLSDEYLVYTSTPAMLPAISGSDSDSNSEFADESNSGSESESEFEFEFESESEFETGSEAESEAESEATYASDIVEP